MYPAYHHSLSGTRVGWPESAPLAAAVGFPACDIWLENAMLAGVSQTLDTLAQHKLRTSVVDMPIDFRTTEAAFDAALPDLDGMAKFAAAIDCPRMTARLDPSGPVPKSEWRPIQLERLQKIAAVLAGHGVRLALEFVSSADLRRLQLHDFLWRMGETLDLIHEIGPNVGLLLDSWHWHYASATPADIRAAGLDRIVHVHINDAPEQFFDHVVDKERLMPGEGVIDLLGFLGALQDLGYEGAVSVEVFASVLKSIPPEHGAKLGLHNIMEVFRKAGIA